LIVKYSFDTRKGRGKEKTAKTEENEDGNSLKVSENREEGRKKYLEIAPMKDK
jgi:hypothetical protein